MSYDSIVLGAGMVGVSTALHLQARGQSTALIDRRAPGEETSFGNAGLIQTEAVMPYSFPRDLRAILSVLTGRSTEARLHWRALPHIAPWLLQYYRHGTPARVMATANGLAPLVTRALAEHETLMRPAGAFPSLRRTGYLSLFRSERRLAAALEAQTKVKSLFGIPFTPCTPEETAKLEPHLNPDFAGAIHLPDPASIPDPAALVKTYAHLFADRGGTLMPGKAENLERTGSGWRLRTESGSIDAPNAIIALGPWSGDALRRQGIRVPLGLKRGYHMHFSTKGNAVLNRIVVDEAHGYVLAPQARGIRLTTGAEFALQTAAKTPVQLRQITPLAKKLFPLESQLDAEPWMGTRPCLPDMLPMIGPIPGQPGLWANFGHHHLGLTLGPATGRLLAEMITGEAPFTSPAPYGVDRFKRG